MTDLTEKEKIEKLEAKIKFYEKVLEASFELINAVTPVALNGFCKEELEKIFVKINEKIK